jgi:cytochrome c oxidase accessory protein FixG
MCPYARFQSAMFDRDTLTVTYDQRRGEPRGSRPRSADPAKLDLGSCIDCSLCVQVCPTGIDIRQGLQYECIGCAACIDVCDDVMDRMDYPRGLIRYTTEREVQRPRDIAKGNVGVLSHLVRPRTLVYATVLTSIFSLWVWALSTRNPLRVDVIRDRNALARIVEDDQIENVFRLQLMNSDEHPHRYRISVSGIPGIRIASASEFQVDAASNRIVALRVQVPEKTDDTEDADATEETEHRRSRPIEIQVTSDDESSQPIREKSVFLVPAD